MAEDRDQGSSRSILEYFSWKDLGQHHNSSIFVHIDTLTDFCSLFDIKSDVEDILSEQASVLGPIKERTNSGLIALGNISRVLEGKFDYLMLLDRSDKASQELADLFEEEAQSRRLVGARVDLLADTDTFKKTVHNVVGFVVIMLSRSYITSLQHTNSSEMQRILYILGFGPHQLASRLLLISVDSNLAIPRFPEDLAYGTLNQTFSSRKPVDWSRLSGPSRGIWRAALARAAFAQVAALYPSEKRLRCVAEREKSRVIRLLESHSSSFSSGWLRCAETQNKARELMEQNQHDAASEMLQAQLKALEDGSVAGPSRLQQVAQFLLLQCQRRGGALTAENAGAALTALLVNLPLRRLDVFLAADAFELAVAQCLVREIYLPQGQAEGTSRSERARAAQAGCVLLFALLRAHLSPAASLAQSYQQAVALGFSDADVLAAVERVELLPGYLAKYVEMLLQLLALQGRCATTISVFRVACERLGRDALAACAARVSAAFVRVCRLNGVDLTSTTAAAQRTKGEEEEKAQGALRAAALQWAELAAGQGDAEAQALLSKRSLARSYGGSSKGKVISVAPHAALSTGFFKSRRAASEHSSSFVTQSMSHVIANSSSSWDEYAKFNSQDEPAEAFIAVQRLRTAADGLRLQGAVEQMDKVTRLYRDIEERLLSNPLAAYQSDSRWRHELHRCILGRGLVAAARQDFFRAEDLLLEALAQLKYPGLRLFGDRDGDARLVLEAVASLVRGVYLDAAASASDAAHKWAYKAWTVLSWCLSSEKRDLAFVLPNDGRFGVRDDDVRAFFRTTVCAERFVHRLASDDLLVNVVVLLYKTLELLDKHFLLVLAEYMELIRTIDRVFRDQIVSETLAPIRLAFVKYALRFCETKTGSSLDSNRLLLDELARHLRVLGDAGMSYAVVELLGDVYRLKGREDDRLVAACLYAACCDSSAFLSTAAGEQVATKLLGLAASVKLTKVIAIELTDFFRGIRPSAIVSFLRQHEILDGDATTVDARRLRTAIDRTMSLLRNTKKLELIKQDTKVLATPRTASPWISPSQMEYVTFTATSASRFASQATIKENLYAGDKKFKKTLVEFSSYHETDQHEPFSAWFALVIVAALLLMCILTPNYQTVQFLERNLSGRNREALKLHLTALAKRQSRAEAASSDTNPLILTDKELFSVNATLRYTAGLESVLETSDSSPLSSSWDVSEVTDIGDLFSTATSFNQPIDTWEIGQIPQLIAEVQGSAEELNEDVKVLLMRLDAKDLLKIGLNFFNGATARDWKMAAYCFQAAAGRDLTLAQYYLGLCYSNGQGVDKDDIQAVRWWTKAAQLGNADAQYSLGRCYMEGSGVMKNTKKGASLYRKAARQGHAMAILNLGVCYDKGLGVDRDSEKAARHYRRAADHGLALAQYNLALSYFNGQGVKLDYAQAILWWKKAAKQQHADAQYNIGNCYQRGLGVNKDSKLAFKWYRRAAGQGHALALLNIGVCYEKGDGAPKNLSKAAEFYRKAAEQGLALAEYNLGLCYYAGQGVPQDYNMTAYWWQRAAKQGLASAQYNLGKSYQHGLGVNKDAEKGAKWLHRAASQGYAQAQFSLAVCYEEGDGVPQNASEAANYYRKAAESGLSAAQHSLGLLYARGRGLSQSFAQAVHWWTKAAQQNHSDAQYRLAGQFALGFGVSQDFAKAEEWYIKAAANGHLLAQLQLGLLYSSGAEGVSQNMSMAVRWWTEAAERGLADAQYHLGRSYQHGFGVPKDDSLAVEWYQRAADQEQVAALLSLGTCYYQGAGVPQDITQAVELYEKAANLGSAKAQFLLGHCYLSGYGVQTDVALAKYWFARAAEQDSAYNAFVPLTTKN